MSKKNKVLFLNGIGGIGRKIAFYFASLNYEIFLVGRDSAKLQSLSDELSCKYASDIIPVEIDFEKNLYDINDIVAKLSVKKCDLLINASGFYSESGIVDIPYIDIFRLINVNFLGPALLTKALLPFMKKGGEIINFSSVGGIIPLENKAFYTASKFAMTGFSKALSKEVKANGIRVHTLYPYLVDSHSDFISERNGKNSTYITSVDDVVEIIKFILGMPGNVVFDDIKIRPFFY